MQKLTPETWSRLIIATEFMSEYASLDNRIAYILDELKCLQEGRPKPKRNILHLPQQNRVTGK